MATTPSNDLNIQDDGYVVFDSSDGTFKGRTFVAGSGITLVNANGIAGNTTISATSSLSDLHTSIYIVSSSGTAGTGANFTNITSAINAANAVGIPATIFVMPGDNGIYTEDITLPANITLTSFSGTGANPVVTLLGKVTMTDTGSSTISNIRLKTNGDNCIAVTGSNAVVLNLVGCFINADDNTAILLNNTNATIDMNYCLGDITDTGIAYFSISAGSVLTSSCYLNNSANSSTSSTISGGSIVGRTSVFHGPFTTSGTGRIQCRVCRFFTDGTAAPILTHGGSNTSQFQSSSLSSGNASAISVSASSIVEVNNCAISSTNSAAIAGAGTIKYAGITFSNNSTITTTTQTPFVKSNDLVKVVTPGAYPYTTTAQDGIIKVDTSAARTITPLSSPETGQRHIIKDTVGSAAANNITVTPSGKNIDGAASYVMNTNYASITIIYTGSEWSIV